MAETLFLAFGLMLVIEGVLPFISPTAWRQVFARMLAMSDGQIRFIGLCSIAVGVSALLFV
ncbi:DUF2065 domain-containing protein [Roseateles sp.]|uniref:DUF2065 domain-containing protein n=1 Tax=Roseateles sp. TaxID=1971397 RepID=UPI00286C312D|nr:DUF2065 domain-containing protein [Roseateles sp.]